MYLIGICVAVVSALLLYLEFSKPAAPQEIPLTAEAKGYIANLALEDVGIQAKLDYFGQKVVEISGNIGNKGDRNLGVVEVSCVFRDYAGKILSRQRSAIVSVKMGGLKPGETKPFRLPFDAIPVGWNNQMPQLVIAGIVFQ
ncbi:MAG: FxLYD domain-containing protein [Bryobacteraceae bacterium]